MQRIEGDAKELQEAIQNKEYDALVDRISSLKIEIENEKALYMGGIRIE